MNRLRGCLKTHVRRRVRARGLQNSTKILVFCRPGPLTGRVFKQALGMMARLSRVIGEELQARRRRALTGPGVTQRKGLRIKAVGDEARPRLDPPHEHESNREPPLPGPLLHKYVEEREMERRARILGIHARNSSANSLHEHKSKRGPPHPDPLLHKCVEAREMERRARVLGIHARNSSANSLPKEREWNKAAPGESNQIQPNQACRAGGGLRPYPEGGLWLVERFRRRDADGCGRDDRAPEEVADDRESNQIKPDQTCGQVVSGRWTVVSASGQTGGSIQAGQTQSKPVKPEKEY
jgi:hypothetical protein